MCKSFSLVCASQLPRVILCFSTLVFLLMTSCSDSLEEPTVDDYEQARRKMLENDLAGRDISDPVVMEAMRKTPRHEFVPPGMRTAAYDDHPLPISAEQTISQPYIVALMTQLLQPDKNQRILEIGTGSGYQAAVLSEMVKHVYTVEIIPELAKTAGVTLKRLNYQNITVKNGDGYQGWPEEAPFDGILVTAAPDHVPAPLIEQLAVGGRLIIPVGTEGHVQQLKVLEKTLEDVVESNIIPVRFVPMTGQAQEAR